MSGRDRRAGGEVCFACDAVNHSALSPVGQAQGAEQRDAQPSAQALPQNAARLIAQEFFLGSNPDSVANCFHKRSASLLTRAETWMETPT